MNDFAADDLWTVDRTAQYLGVPKGTLYQWRHRRIGPPVSKLGRHLRYDPAVVRDWVRQQREQAA
jgi:transposase-like protein